MRRFIVERFSILTVNHVKGSNDIDFVGEFPDSMLVLCLRVFHKLMNVILTLLRSMESIKRTRYHFLLGFVDQSISTDPFPMCIVFSTTRILRLMPIL